MMEMTTRTNGMFANGSLAARPASAAATIPNPECAFVMCWRVLAGGANGGQISNSDGRAGGGERRPAVHPERGRVIGWERRIWRHLPVIA